MYIVVLQESTVMIIDAFTHVLPQCTLAAMEKLGTDFGTMGSRVKAMRQLYDLDARFRAMDEFGDYRQIISLSSPPIEEVAKPSESSGIAMIANEEMASLVDRHRDRFAGFVATVALHDVDAAIVELGRAVSELGACGVQLFTDIGGRPLDDPEYEPVFDFVHRSGLPIWLHPTRQPLIVDYLAEDASYFDMWQIMGWPYATSVAMMRLVLTGVFERFAGIKIITHHLGGMIPFHAVRAERGLLRESMVKTAKGPAARTVPLRRPPLQYLKQFYADTAMHGADSAVRCGLEFFGENRVLFATDHPFGTIQTGVDMIPKLQLDRDAEHKLCCGNIARLLGKKLRQD
jgi:aminocarboxymuconate-semialdehyde decarboxylase